MGKETSEIGGWAENALLDCFRGGPSGTWLDYTPNPDMCTEVNRDKMGISVAIDNKF